jgi:endoglucanase
MYGGVLPYFRVVEPELAEEIFLKKLASLYNQDTEDFKYPLGYYDQNWVWFGMAFYDDKLPNLFETGEMLP